MALLIIIQADEIQQDRSVTSHRVDSLVELQLRNWITGHLGASVSMVELMSSMPLTELARITAKRSRLVGRMCLRPRITRCLKEASRLLD